MPVARVSPGMSDFYSRVIVVASGTVDVDRVSGHTSTVMEEHVPLPELPERPPRAVIMAGRSFDTFGPSSLPFSDSGAP